MFICICNAVRETDLRRIACEQRGDAETLYTRLGFAPQCRQCLQEADMIVEEARACILA